MRPIHGLVSLTLLIGCGTDSSSGDDMPPPATGPTWYQDVAPILSEHCMSCHQAGGIAPFSLTDYDSAKTNAVDAASKIDSGAMPPWNASTEADCAPTRGWQDDPSLSADDKATIHSWIDTGMAEGTVAQIPPPKSNDLSGVTMTLTPTQPFTAAGSRDLFECFILDPQVTTPIAWMTGMQVRPGNAAVVHHAVISEIAPGADLDALLAQHQVGVPFDCEAGQPANFTMAIWTPGNQPMETPDGQLAVPIQKGAMIVMQIHYHPAMLTNAPDTTSVDLRLSQNWPQKMYFVAAFGNAPTSPQLLPDPDDSTTTPEFTIPANKQDHVENMVFTIPDLTSLGDTRIYSVNPHMHLTGTHINGKLTRLAPGTEPASECLANGGWNFDWQRTYTYDTTLDQLPSIKTGDTLAIDCHWDNTVENPFVQRMMHDSGLVAPIDIHLGEMTTNEMCLEIFGIAIPAPAKPTGLAPVVLPNIGLNMSSL
jgi:hypothetical protein